MKIYNESKTEIIENPDLALGYLKSDTLSTHHEAVTPIKEVGHYETIAEYPNGGKDVAWVVDVQGRVGNEAYDETEDIQVYIPYTEAQLKEMEYSKEISELKRYLSDTDYCVIKSLENGVSVAEAYPEAYQKRAEARARINELEELMESL